jgi:PAS domain S-box-containing protein
MSQAILSRLPIISMLVIASVLVAAIAILSWNTENTWQTSSAQSKISSEIQNATGELLDALRDAETAQRGYLLTGKETYLEPYHKAVNSLPGTLRRLEASTVPRPDQAARLREMKPTVEAKMKELAASIQLNKENRVEEALQIVETGEGKKLMDDIRASCAEITSAASARVVSYSEQAERAVFGLGWISVVGSVLLLGFLGLFGRTIFDGLDKREQLYRETATNAELLRVTLSSIGDGVIATDASMNISFINPVAQQLTGWTEAEALGTPIASVFPIVNETTRVKVTNPLERALSEGVVVGLANHTVLMARNGKEIPIDDSGAPIRDNTGKIVGAVLVFRDISDRKESDRLIAESNEQLQAFVDAAAHDMRAPLRSVNNFTQLLARRSAGVLDQDSRRYLDIIVTTVRRMDRLLDDLLAYAQASHFGTEVSHQTPLEGAFRTAVQNLRADIESSQAEVRTEGPLPVVGAYDAHVVQLLQNLIGNAIQYRGDRSPEIVVTARPASKKEWMICVQDNGIGIEAEHLDYIFKPFRRLHGDDNPGSGIGLATCTKVVNGYGGRIWAESEPGKGSKFYFTLPVADPTQRIL